MIIHWSLLEIRDNYNVWNLGLCMYVCNYVCMYVIMYVYVCVCVCACVCVRALQNQRNMISLFVSYMRFTT